MYTVYIHYLGQFLFTSADVCIYKTHRLYNKNTISEGSVSNPLRECLAILYHLFHTQSLTTYV